jgi:hypothetical protein
MSVRRTTATDSDGFSVFMLTCDRCGEEWATTVSGAGGIPAVRLLACIFAGWDVVPNGIHEADADLCPKHMTGGLA